MDVRMTRHAEERLIQRGIRREVLQLVLAYADVETGQRGGVTQLRLSRAALVDACGDGVAIGVIERARDVAAILDGRRVLTQYRCRRRPGQPRTRRNYRRGGR